PADTVDETLCNFSPLVQAFIPSGLYQGIFNFEEIEDKSFGLPRLAALRMDVDNLGQIFRAGLSGNDQTFSRLAAISRALNLFFKYHLNALLCGEKTSGFSYPPALDPYDWAGRNVREDGRRVAIIYSGGDDLFLMGHWLDICEAAFDIVKAFQAYTGNPELTISGGITMGHIRMPVYQYAELAGAAENQAKGHRKEKNALALFGKVIPNENMNEMKNILDIFASFLTNQETHMTPKEEGLTRGFFYNILNSAREFLDEENTDRILVLPRLAYLLARVRKKLPPENYLELQNYLLSYNEETWEKIFIAVQWVIMSMRGGKDE
ncbi:type III-A CRISPR-associated protein Cas10/Csm1, partial [Thermodesulfatator autotrophicus]|uniref:type III-A CRISPR-associated protein Cas10/Csm1 n=1 Tax=Thermodesulfatator autotrophicus TaxID=1795632 RepID=UPI000A5F2E1B